MARFLIIAVISVLVGCDSVGNDGATVGGSCTSSSQCDDTCLTGGDFPDGVCTLRCNTDEDCPGGAFCIEHEGGICLLGCLLPSDCRIGYSCEGKSNAGHGGDSLVCID